MKLEYKGYTIVQSNYNNHVCIYKNNKLVMHLSVTQKLSESELKSIVEIFLIRS